MKNEQPQMSLWRVLPFYLILGGMGLSSCLILGGMGLSSRWVQVGVLVFYGLLILVASVQAAAKLIFQGLIVPMGGGEKCSECRERTLAFQSCVSFGDRFYRCESCGHRSRRGGITDAWENASGPEFDWNYASAAERAVWPPKKRAPGRSEVSKALAAMALMAAYLGFGAVGYWVAGFGGCAFASLLGPALFEAWRRRPKTPRVNDPDFA